jgi:hypothetical protein
VIAPPLQLPLSLLVSVLFSFFQHVHDVFVAVRASTSVRTRALPLAMSVRFGP